MRCYLTRQAITVLSSNYVIIGYLSIILAGRKLSKQQSHFASHPSKHQGRNKTDNPHQPPYGNSFCACPRACTSTCRLRARCLFGTSRDGNVIMPHPRPSIRCGCRLASRRLINRATKGRGASSLWGAFQSTRLLNRSRNIITHRPGGGCGRDAVYRRP